AEACRRSRPRLRLRLDDPLAVVEPDLERERRPGRNVDAKDGRGQLTLELDDPADAAIARRRQDERLDVVERPAGRGATAYEAHEVSNRERVLDRVPETERAIGPLDQLGGRALGQLPRPRERRRAAFLRKLVLPGLQAQTLFGGVHREDRGRIAAWTDSSPTTTRPRIRAYSRRSPPPTRARPPHTATTAGRRRQR